MKTQVSDSSSFSVHLQICDMVIGKSVDIVYFVLRFYVFILNTILGGNESARNKHTSRGKMLPRDRVTNLLDPG